MATFIAVYHGGVVITNKIGNYEFVEMKKEIFLLNRFLTLTNVIRLVQERLGWMDECCDYGLNVKLISGRAMAPR
jgi:hypothetical protein